MNRGTYTIGEIASIVGAKLSGAGSERVVEGYCLDSRKVEAGQLFVAVRGERVDGHEYVGRALEAGAAGAMVCRDMEPAPDGPVLRVDDCEEALKRLAAHHRAANPVPIVAVTGTNGKTTTKDVISRVLSSQADVCASVGNLNSQLGMPLTLLNRLRPGHRFGVFEVGMSARGEIERLCAVLRPTLGVVTGVGVAHTQFLGSIENVFLAKSELVQALPADGRLYLNAECRFHGRMREAYAGTTCRVSLGDRTAEVFLEVEAVDLAGVRGTLTIAGDEPASAGSPGGSGADERSEEPPIPGCPDRPKGGPRRLWMPIPGLHMAYPALFAVAVARDLGLDVGRALESLAECRPAPHRMSVVARGGLTILDDCYNANPPSTEALLEFVRKVAHPGRKVLVLGDMLELGDLAIQSHARVVAQALKATAFGPIFLVGPIYHEAAATLPEAERASESGRLKLAASRDAVLGELSRELQDGDLLVLKASRGIGLDALLDSL